MLTIRALARRFDLSRATLLYYDRIGLLHPSARSKAGYRLYDADAEARLANICAYKSAGLPLDAVAQLLDGPETSETCVFMARLRELDHAAEQLKAQQHALAELIARSGDHPTTASLDKAAWVGILRAAGMNDVQMNDWHKAFETNAPEAHDAFLRWLGIDEAEIAHLRDMARQEAEPD